MPSKQFWLGSAAGAGILLVAIVGIAAAFGHPVPHIFKKGSADSLVTKNLGVYWTLMAASGSADTGALPALSVSKAKQIADVLGSSVFQTTSTAPGIVSFLPNKPADSDVTNTAGGVYYVKAL
jgi:hypothetical protein